MATASCGSITVNGYRFYNGGWSETTFRSLAASYSRTGGDPDYVTVDKITLPSFTNAKFVAPYTLKLSIPITKGLSTATTTSGTLTVHMYSSDPGGTKQYATSPSPTNPPSGYIGSGSASYSGLNNDIQTFNISVKISNTDLTSGTSYYLWIQTTSLTMIHLEGKAPTGTLTGTVATFPVTYDANGGSPTPSSQTKTYGNNLTLRDDIPTKSSTSVTGYKVTFEEQSGSTVSDLTSSKITSYTFSSWKGSDNNTYSAGGTYSGNASLTLTAQYKSSTSNGAITLPSTTRSNYNFNGWYTAKNGGTRVGGAKDSYKPSAAITLYAQWSANTATATFNANGGTDPNPGSIVKNIGEALGTLPTTSRTGYQFKGWYTATSGGTQITTSTTMPSGGVTYYAQWTANTYFVKFNGNSSTNGSMSNQSFTYGTAQKLTANAFTRSFKVTYNANGGTTPTAGTATATFNGWATSASGAVKYTNQQSVSNLTSTNGGTVNLYANWTDGSVTLPNMTRTNYSFNGWYTKSSGGTLVGVGGDTYTPTEAVTLYAQWTATKVTITLNPNGGSVSTTTYTKTPGAYMGTLPNATRSGYTFKGWYTATSGGTKITQYTKVPNINTTYYAQWGEITYTISYNANGGTGAPADQTKTHGTDIYLSSTKPTYSTNATGYVVKFYANDGTTTVKQTTSTNVVTQVFLSWNTKSDGSGTTYQSGGLYSKDADVLLYAQYDSTNNASITQYGSITPQNFNRSGYSLLGFSTDSEATSAMYTVTDSIIVYGPMELYAIWKPNTYNMTIDPNGGHIYYNGTYIPEVITTKFAYGVPTYIGVMNKIQTDPQYSYTTGTELSLASKTGYSWGGSTSSYNQNYSISDTLVYNSLSLENPGVVTITSLDDCETLKDKYILFNNTTYFIPSSATFSEASSGSSFSKTYTLKCSGAQAVSLIPGETIIDGYIEDNSAILDEKTFVGYASNAGSAFKNTSNADFYFEGQSKFDYLLKGNNSNTWVFNGNSLGDVTITANFRNQGYTVIYDVNNPKLDFSWSNTYHEVGAYATLQTATSTNLYEFLGWNTKADGSGTMYASGENVINLTTVDGAEIILYAQWKLKNLVKIHTNNAFQNAQMYIWKDNKWNLVTVYVYKNNNWKMSTGN